MSDDQPVVPPHVTAMGLAVVSSVIAILGLVLSGYVKPPDTQASGVVLGILSAALLIIVCFYFGSSWGSRSKDITHVVKPIPPPPVPPIPQPTPPPIPPGPGPGPVARTPRNVRITGTSFAGPKDSESSRTSAYPPNGLIEYAKHGIALPLHFTGTRPRVRVFCNGKSVDCDIVDVGPWNTNNPYWTAGARPAAEAEHANGAKAQNGRVPTNPAGIDLTPGAWAALGFTGDLDKITAIVSWDFVDYLDSAAPGPPGPTPSTTVPPWLEAMKDITGTHEVDGDGDNPTILGWAAYIGKKYPDMAEYCAGYKHDAVPWCGLTVAYCMAAAGIRPQFGATDTDRFLWANSWTQFGVAIETPQPGDVLVFKWANGGHHVTLYDHETDGDKYACRGGNQGDEVNVTLFPMAACIAIRRPA